MSAPERALRVVGCEECERLRQSLNETLTDLDHAEAEIKMLRRRLATARESEKAERKQHPDHKVAERLFEFWKEQCDHPKAQLGPKREQALLSRLAQYTPRQIAMAIRGAAVAAYTDDKGVRYDDLELICRNEVKLEQFIERYERWKENQA